MNKCLHCQSKPQHTTALCKTCFKLLRDYHYFTGISWYAAGAKYMRSVRVKFNRRGKATSTFRLKDEA